MNRQQLDDFLQEKLNEKPAAKSDNDQIDVWYEVRRDAFQEVVRFLTYGPEPRCPTCGGVMQRTDEHPL